MAAHGVVLRQRVCVGCRAVFWICQHCDRGHRYCSAECRAPARLEQRRRANCRHQRSPEGRLDHRDRQREYRRRKPLRVTDQGSVSITFPATCSSGIRITPRRAPFLRCIICGRSSRWVDPFPRIPRTRR